MTYEKLLRITENSRRMFPQRPRKSAMNMLELTEEDEEILDKVWAELAEEKGIKRPANPPIKEAA